MLLEIFLPEKIGRQRILSKRILGIALQEGVVTVTQVFAKSSKTLVQAFYKQSVEPGSDEALDARTIDAIKKAIAQTKKSDHIRVAIPASMVLFKELELPFIDREKIRMVLDYEVESMLPFDLNDAVIDFIITQSNHEKKTSQVLVAAIRNQDLTNILSLYHQAGLQPEEITVDLFSLYGLYQQIPEYTKLPHATALVDLGAHSTRIAFLDNGQLRLTRSMPRGIATVFNAIGDELSMPVEQVALKLSSAGLLVHGDDNFVRSAQKHVINFLNDIQFTLNSFSLKLSFYDGVSKILFFGQVDQIRDLMAFSSNTLQIPCEIFDGKKIFENKAIKNKLKEQPTNWPLYALSLGTAIPSEQQNTFDLRRKSFALVHKNLITQQLITAAIGIVAILLTVGMNGYLDVRALEQAAEKREASEIARIKNSGIFAKNTFPKKPTLQGLVRDTERLAQEKKALWEPFVRQRVRPLEVFLELTRIINKKQFDTTIDEVDFVTDRAKQIPSIEVSGYFRSKTGSDHFKYFTDFENRFKESNLLRLNDIITRPAAENGVKFTAKLTLHDEK